MDKNFFYTGNRENDYLQKESPDNPGEYESKTEYAGKEIDLNEKLVRNRTATYFMWVNCNAMIDSGIHKGDMIIVDRSMEPVNGKLIIAMINGEMLIRKLEIHNNKKRLVPATKNLSAIEITEEISFKVWGVVTYVIQSV